MGTLLRSRFSNRLPQFAAKPQRHISMTAITSIVIFIVVTFMLIMLYRAWTSVGLLHVTNTDFSASVPGDKSAQILEVWSMGRRRGFSFGLILGIVVSLLLIELGIPYLTNQKGLVENILKDFQIFQGKPQPIKKGTSFILSSDEKFVDFTASPQGFRWLYHKVGDPLDKVTVIDPISKWPLPNGVSPDQIEVFLQSESNTSINSNLLRLK